MSITAKLTASAVTLMSVGAMGAVAATSAHADEVHTPAPVVSAPAVQDTTSDAAIAEKAKLVINGYEKDGKTIIPTGEDRVKYLTAQHFDAQKVQNKVNEILSAETPAPVYQAPKAPVAPAHVAQASAAPAAPAAPTAQATQEPAAPAAQSPAQHVGDSNSAKEWIAQKESGGSYTARNGQYVGRYQLTDSYLHGDYSPANQESVADSYVQSRYGSWSAAQAFWQSHGWY